MDRRIIAATLSLLLCASVAWGRMGLMVVGGTPQSAAPSYLINEDFNASGTPSGWSTGGTVTSNFDATTTAMEGAQYLTIDYESANGYVLTPTFTTSTTVYIAGRARIRTFPATTDAAFILLYNNTSGLGYVRMNTTGSVHAFPYGGSSSAYAACFTANTTKFIKARYVAGSGSNASITVWDSTDGQSWTQLATSSNGTATLGADRIRLGQNQGIDWDVDTIRVDDEDINF